MAGDSKQRRVAERIRQSVTTSLERKVKDPRLGFVTVTDVRVTGDLQNATVYYTVMGGPEQEKETRRALQSAKGLIRSQMGSALGMRLTPTLSFRLDSLPESAASIEEALAAARVRDAQIAEAAQGKDYAGEAKPYKEVNDSRQEEESTMVDLPESAEVEAEAELKDEGENVPADIVEDEIADQKLEKDLDLD